jgi:hypothetical protein
MQFKIPQEYKKFILGATAAFVLLFGIVLFLLLRPRNTQDEVTIPTRTQTPIIKYDQKKTDQMLKILDEKPSLTEQDQETKKQLIDSLGNNSGILVNRVAFMVEYVKTADEFMVEIRSTDIEKAKEDAVVWLKEQGFTQDGICNLPVVFYPNIPRDQMLNTIDKSFNPLAPGC